MMSTFDIKCNATDTMTTIYFCLILKTPLRDLATKKRNSQASILSKMKFMKCLHTISKT